MFRNLWNIKRTSAANCLKNARNENTVVTEENGTRTNLHFIQRLIKEFSPRDQKNLPISRDDTYERGCTRWYARGDTRKRNYTCIRERRGRRQVTVAPASRADIGHPPFVDATGQPDEQTDGVHRLLSCPRCRTGIALLTSLTLDTYRKVFPVRARSLSQAHVRSRPPGLGLSSLSRTSKG